LDAALVGNGVEPFWADPVEAERGSPTVFGVDTFCAEFVEDERRSPVVVVAELIPLGVMELSVAVVVIVSSCRRPDGDSCSSLVFFLLFE
jgi:hypothetical protein